MSGWSSSGWPSPDRADDERLARSLTAGDDTEALIQLLDRYAARLYDYCHALLRDQEQAAGALHDAVLAAYIHAGRLREQDRFRGWLYALVRNECLRRLRDPGRPTERVEAPEVEDMFLGAGERERRLETRRLVHSALSGLRGRERETLDLLLRHGLDAPEIAGVLGIDAQAATDLAGEARRRLDGTLAAVIIARTGRQECPHVAELAEEGDAPLPPAVTRRLLRHIETCAICTERRHRTVSTAGLLQALPVALMPADLRGHILATATDPAYMGDMQAIAQGAEPFDTWGWPMPAERHGAAAGGVADDEGERRRPRSPRLWPAVAAAAAVLLLALGAFMVVPGSGDKTGAQGPRNTTAAPDASEPVGESADPSDSPTPSPTLTTPTPTPSTTSPTPTPSRTRASRTPKPPKTTLRPARGTLTVSNPCGTIAAGSDCTISISARGGPVTWTASAGGGLSVSPSGGRLASGASTGVSVTAPACGSSGSGGVSFSPGGTASVSWTCPESGPDD
ncbi:sigma-70 family RNA polymerase sigma factor [Actinomadura sp. 9N407]|uniref:sigma-70 family RNA polymerase sigma factor n=1 Tax=Actinomadura sp. 9N407 TaxID=3375154 RepID=UPI0037905C88